uniref:Uncharacterized protein n=1 Tax=Meloidogyne hapla TaxID=6305 RepID=A0A1I8BVJ2_MELHA
MFLNKQNFVTNRIELRTFLQSLACNNKEAEEERKAGVKKFYEICKYPTDNKNYMREIKFGKIIKVSGTIQSFYGPRILGPLNMEENEVLLLSLQLGNNENNFAILTDEMNGYVYNILSNIERKTIQEIAENGGALALIGPDMNMKGELIVNNHFDVNIVSQKSCTGIIQLTLNNELLNKQFSCVSFFYKSLEEFPKTV